MNKSYIYTHVLPVFVLFCVTVVCTDTDECFLSSKNKNEEEKLLNRISPLFGQIFRTEKNGFSYAVAICSDTSELHANVSATKTQFKGETSVLGRRNDTYLNGGDTWILLRYKSGDKLNNCSNHHSTSIYVVCDPIKHEDPHNIVLAEDDGCNYKFILPSTNICQHEEEVSGNTVFFVVFAIIFFLYFIIGIVYRRFVHNAEGCQQLPHFGFWRKIGALLSDGCNYVCRCDTELEDSWNNITSNFDSGDRDDALLRP